MYLVYLSSIISLSISKGTVHNNQHSDKCKWSEFPLPDVTGVENCKYAECKIQI